MTSDEQIDAIAEALWNKRATGKDELARVLREIGLKEYFEASKFMKRAIELEYGKGAADDFDVAEAKLERETQK